MNQLRRRSDWRTALSVGLVVGLAAMIGMWILAASRGEASVSAPPASNPQQFVHFLAGVVLFNLVGPVLTAGTPAALFVRYGLVTPVAVFVLGFVLVTGLASAGSVPGYYVALALFWPGYVLTYLLVGGVERLVRDQVLPAK